MTEAIFVSRILGDPGAGGRLRGAVRRGARAASRQRSRPRAGAREPGGAARGPAARGDVGDDRRRAVCPAAGRGRAGDRERGPRASAAHRVARQPARAAHRGRDGQRRAHRLARGSRATCSPSCPASARSSAPASGWPSACPRCRSCRSTARSSPPPSAPRSAAIREGRRRIVLATAIAETSITLDGVSVVVDAGLSRRAEFDLAAGVTHLVTHRASQAAAAQRAGRAARQGPGVAYRLWEEAAHPGPRGVRSARDADRRPRAAGAGAGAVGRRRSGLARLARPAAAAPRCRRRASGWRSSARSTAKGASPSAAGRSPRCRWSRGRRRCCCSARSMARRARRRSWRCCCRSAGWAGAARTWRSGWRAGTAIARPRAEASRKLAARAGRKRRRGSGDASVPSARTRSAARHPARHGAARQPRPPPRCLGRELAVRRRPRLSARSRLAARHAPSGWRSAMRRAGRRGARITAALPLDDRRGRALARRPDRAPLACCAGRGERGRGAARTQHRRDHAGERARSGARSRRRLRICLSARLWTSWGNCCRADAAGARPLRRDRGARPARAGATRRDDWLAPLLDGRRDLAVPAARWPRRCSTAARWDERQRLDRLAPREFATPGGHAATRSTTPATTRPASRCGCRRCSGSSGIR